MGFIDAWKLAWLGLLVPVIIFFYLLKLRRRELRVSSVLLWAHVLRDMQANAPFQRLRKNLLLFLQLLIAALAIFALARPYVMAPSLGGQNAVVILDASASMQSRDVGRSRFAEARAEALRMVDRMSGGDRMMVILAGPRTEPLTHSFTADTAALRRALRGAQSTDGEANLREALLLAASVSGASAALRGSRIYLFSDGAFDDLGDLDLRGAEFHFVQLGERSENVGIVALDVRRPLGGDDTEMQCFLALRNYGQQEREGTLELYRDNSLVDARRVSLGPADPERGYTEVAEVFTLPPAASGILRARLDLPDDLDVDNEAYAQIEPQRSVRVLLVSDIDPDHSFLARALNADPHVEVTAAFPQEYTGQDGFDVIVFENEAPRAIGPGGYLYVNATGETSPAEVSGWVPEVAVTDWERGHPLLRFVDLGQVVAEQAAVAAPKPWARTLATHERGPVLIAGERADLGAGDAYRSAYLGMPVAGSNFWHTVSFPIFVNNAVQWLSVPPGQSEGFQLRVGQTAVIDAPDGVERVTVIDPAGERHQVAAAGRLAYFAETRRRGIYRVTAPDYEREFVVNLLSRRESDTAPRDTVRLGQRPVQAADRTSQSPKEHWRWLALAALLILMVEWFIYHRRV